MSTNTGGAELHTHINNACLFIDYTATPWVKGINLICPVIPMEVISLDFEMCI